MSWYKIIIDTMGIGFELYLVMLFYSTFWIAKTYKKSVFILGCLLFLFINLALTELFQNQVWLPISFMILVFFFGFYFRASFSSRLFLCILFTAIIVISETVVGIIQTRIFGLEMESLQNSIAPYITGVLGSKLFALILIYVIRFFFVPKDQNNKKWFNLIMISLPFQSLLICFLVAQNLVMVNANPESNMLYGLALFVSFALIGITTFILNNQLKSLQREYEHKETMKLLNIQVEHYNELYRAGQALKAIRHDLKNEYIALSGLLSENKVDEALKAVNNSVDRIQSAKDIVDTGFPAVDAIVNSKIGIATENNITIRYKMLMDNQLFIDQFDIAIILANALDNALEALVGHENTDNTINAVISGKNDFISILVENHVSGDVDMQLKTTKEDKDNHGFGLQQMQFITDKYDGDLTVDFDEKRQVFTLNILLMNNMPA